MHFNILYNLEIYNRQGHVQLLDIMPSDASHMLDDGEVTISYADQRIVAAARVSYGGEVKTIKDDAKLLKYLFTNQHTSPFEMVEYMFRIKAPLMAWNQIVRHRTASYNLKSYRYTNVEETDEFYVPYAWRVQDKKNKQGSAGFVDKCEEDKFYNMWGDNSFVGDVPHNSPTSDVLEMHYSLSLAMYKDLLELGYAKEQARLFIPSYGLMTEGIMKIDLHNLLRFISLRADSHAQYEIRVIADAMKECVRYFNPLVASVAFGE